MSNELSRVIYLSRSMDNVNSNAMLSMCGDFAARNAQHQITGLLLLVGDHFIQLIEGAPDKVTQLMDNITRDKRHRDLMLLTDRPAEKRIFGTWAMRGVDIDANLDISQALRMQLQHEIHAISQDADRDPSLARRLISDTVQQLLKAQQPKTRLAS